MNNKPNAYQFIFKFYNNIHINIFKLYKMQKDVMMFIITYKILLEMFKVQLKINNKNYQINLNKIWHQQMEC